MSIRRFFLGWQQPALVSAVQFLQDEFGPASAADGVVPEWNLEQVTLVVPGSRAGRKLQERLVREAEARQWALIPPRIETAGNLPEQLYRPQRPFALDLVQQLAWVKALEAAPETTTREVFPHLRWSAPGDSGGNHVLRDGLELSRVLQRLHFELAADGLSFAQVADHLRPLGLDIETRRWQALTAIQQAYLKVLDDLELWDKQTARLVAIEKRECRTKRHLVLIGVADLNVALRQMLDQVADQVTALVFAPPEFASRFDEHGCLLADAWQHADVRVRDEQLRAAGGPSEQAELVVELVAEHARSLGPHEIVVGVPDETLVPTLQRHLEDAGAEVRWGVGRPLLQTGPARLLDALARYVETPNYAEFAALIRHPDVFRWLSVSGEASHLIAESDAYFDQHLQPALDEWLEGPGQRAELQAAQSRVNQLLRPHHRSTKRIGQWPEILSGLLAEIYGERTFQTQVSQDQEYIKALRQLRQQLAEMAEIPAILERRVTLPEFVQILNTALAHDYVAPLVGGDAVELLGWLELPLDLAPACIVTSFNEGKVPSATNSDLFLPNSLRQRLGLLDNHRRFARDAYAVQALAASRVRVDFIVAHRDQKGDPLVPSRLALADTAEVIASRVSHFLREQAAEDRGLAKTGGSEQPALFGARRRAIAEASGFVVPPPKNAAIPTKLAVTALRTYLTCPYRFYLQHVLKLQARSDEAEEMSALAFGSLLHDVLNEFGQGPCKDSTDALQIAEFLEDALEARATIELGRRRLPAVQVQLSQMRLRLRAFAAWQAVRAGEGWRIAAVEQACSWQVADEQHAPITVDGRTLTLSGRIDRIDRRGPDEWIVYDYKSSDGGKSPEQTHRKNGVVQGEKTRVWTDLQLPVYRRLVPALGVPANAALGYINLPKDVTAVKAAMAEWTEVDLQAADRTLVDVTRRILSGEFWPPALTPPKYEDDYYWICQNQALDRTLPVS